MLNILLFLCFPIDNPLFLLSKLTINLYVLYDICFWVLLLCKNQLNERCYFSCQNNVGSIAVQSIGVTRGQSWLCQPNFKLDCVCSSDLFTSPAECHVVAGHPAGCNDRLHSNLPDTQQDKTSSQLLFCVWNCISILLLFSPTSFLSFSLSLASLAHSLALLNSAFASFLASGHDV